MSFLPGWRAAFRIARRDALRSKGRSSLVVAMIALPVLGVTAADVTYRSSTPTAAEELTATMGSADAVFSSAGIGPVQVEQLPDLRTYDVPPGAPQPDSNTAKPVDVPGAFPKGSRYVTEQSVPATVTTRHGIANIEIVELRTSDPAVRGKLDLVDGTYPDGKDEVVATERFLEAAALGIGSRTTLRGPGQTYTITGSVEVHSSLGRSALYAEPGAVVAPWKAAAARDDKVVPPNPSDTKWLVQGAGGAGVTWSDVLAANKKGVLALSRQVALDPPPDSQVPLAARAGPGFPDNSAELSAAVVTVVAMAVLEVVLLAGPAFAVGARRSRRQLGLLGTCGGDRSQVRAVVLAGGAVLGGFGAVAGVAGGLGLTVLFRPMIEGWTESRFGALEIRFQELLAIALIGFVTGILAALAPAIVAGRQSVLESLTGRRGTRRSSRVLPVVGCVALAGGIAVAVVGGTGGDTTLVAGGSIVAELGVLACIPVIVGFLGRLGSRLPLSPRMALRDAARNRGRTAPAVAAVMAAVAGTVAIATYTTSVTAEHAYDHVPMLTPGTAALVSSESGPASSPRPCRSRTESGRQRRPCRLRTRLGRLRLRRLLRGGGRLRHARAGQTDRKGPQLPAPGARGPEAGPRALRRRAQETDELPRVRRRVHPGVLVQLGPRQDRRGGHRRAHLVREDRRSRGGQGTGERHTGAAEPRLREGRPGHPEGRPHVQQAGQGEPEAAPGQGQDHHGAVGRVRRAREVRRHPRGPHDHAAEHGGPARTAHPGPRQLLHRRAPPTEAEQQALRAAFAQVGNSAYLQSEQGPSSRDEDVVLLILALFAGVVTLGAAAITTGLAKADAEADLTTLSAVGAPPGVRRSLSGFQCLVVALTGVLLGTVAGVVPAVSLRLIDLRDAMESMRAEPMNSAYTPIVLPWETIGLLALVVPVLAGLLAATFAGKRLTLTRRAG